MSTMLAEQPLLISAMLGAFGCGLLFAWMQTGKKAAAVLGLVCLALIPVAFVVASKLETDREQIERMIYETADAVERNDFDRVYQLIGNADARRMAQQELPNYEFTMARVNKLRSIEILEGAYPPEADAELSVKVDVSGKRGGIRNVRVVRKLLLRFEKRDDVWVVTDYKHMPIVGGPDGYSTP
jgi:hypothetical protein